MSDVESVSTGEQYATGIVKKDGTLWMCGSNYHGELGDGSAKQRNTPVKVMNNVKSVYAGDLTTAIVKKDSTLWMCGKNSDAQFGNGHRKNRNLKPVKVM